MSEVTLYEILEGVAAELARIASRQVQGYLAHKKPPPPPGLPWGPRHIRPRGRRFLMSEAPLYSNHILGSSPIFVPNSLAVAPGARDNGGGRG